MYVTGKQADFHLHENTRVSGEFRGCDVEFSEIFVRSLETPIGKIPEAILRGGDIIYLDIGDINIDQWTVEVEKTAKSRWTSHNNLAYVLYQLHRVISFILEHS